MTNRSRAYIAVGCITLLLLACPGSARALSFTSTVSEDNGVTTNGKNDPTDTTPDQNQDVYQGTTNHPGVLTAGTGYNFSGSYTKLSSITSISLTLTMLNGSSATAAQETAGGNATSVNDFDVNHLVLYLGGTYNATTGILTGATEVMLANNTPLYLNGFLTNDAQTTLSLSNVMVNTTTGMAILSTLQANGGLLAAYVGTDNPNDTSPTQGTAGMGFGPAEIFLGNTGNPATANAVTSLTLTGVPEPATAALLALAAAAGLFAWRARWSRPRRKMAAN